MKSDVAIQVENLSKVYQLRQPRVDEEGNTTHEHWALNNISFEIKKGESIGIIGPNGSGKSTLLKVLAGVTKPSSGKVNIRGKVASILDIGAGFHPELSGAENILLNGQIHGFSKKEIEDKFDEIVAFSGIEKFIQEPVKNYSNGMYLRLAFSIMVHLDFDVYLFDEVFSVGDAQFSLKTIQKLEGLITNKKTILFVSHDLTVVDGLERYLFLEKGKLATFGQSRNPLADYLEKMTGKGMNIQTNNHLEVTDFSSHANSQEVSLIKVHLYQNNYESEITTDQTTYILIHYKKKTTDGTLDPIIYITDISNRIVLSSSPFISGEISTETCDDEYSYICKIPPFLFHSQVYQISVSFFKNVISLKDDHKNKSLLDTEKLTNNNLDILPTYKNLITFKPTLKLQGLEIKYSEKLNLVGSLLAGFDWQKQKLKN